MPELDLTARGSKPGLVMKELLVPVSSSRTVLVKLMIVLFEAI